MFKRNRKHPSPPFTFNKLIYRMLNKKVKGEGLKTLFIYVRVGKGKKVKSKSTLGSKIEKALKRI